MQAVMAWVKATGGKLTVREMTVRQLLSILCQSESCCSQTPYRGDKCGQLRQAEQQQSG